MKRPALSLAVKEELLVLIRVVYFSFVDRNILFCDITLIWSTLLKFNHLRIARPVSDLNKSCEMYCLGFGFNIIAQFKDHRGFNGIMLGKEDLNWHLEFTQCLDHPICPQQTVDDLLVLYIPSKPNWIDGCHKIMTAGFIQVPSFNPYWDIHGCTFIDKDGYRSVLQHQTWSTE